MSTPWANENCWPVEVTHDGRPGCMQFLRCYSRISPTVNTVWDKSRESMSLYDALERNTWVAFTKIKAVHTRGAQAHDQFRIRESITPELCTDSWFTQIPPAESGCCGSPEW